MLPRSRPSSSLLLPALALAALIGWTMLSLSWTESDESTFAELSRLLGYSGIVVGAWACLNRYTFRAAAAGLSMAALGIAVVALASRLAPSSFPADEIAIAFDLDRLNYPLDYWNAVAAGGCISIAIGLVWSAHGRTRIVRALALAAVPAAGLTVYLTYSRAGVAGAAIALAAALLLSRHRWTLAANGAAAGVGTAVAILVARGQPAIADATGGEGGALVAAAAVAVGAACAGVALLTKQAGLDQVSLGRIPRPVAVATAVGAMAVALIAASGTGVLSDAWDEFLHEDTVAETARGTERLTSLGGDRDELWGSAVDAFSSEPLTGIGPGSFDLWWARDGREPAPVEDAHSLYLETMAELGLPGALLLLTALGGLWVLAFVALGEQRRDSDAGACAAMLAGSTVFLFHAGVDWMWEYPSLVMIGIGGLAIASAAGMQRFSGGKLRARTRVAAVVACLLAGAVQIPGISSTEFLRDAEVELAEGDAQAARDLADDASSAEPWAATPLSRRALAAESLGDLDSARDDLIEAREREPTNWLWAVQLARIEGLLGNAVAAEQALEDARRLNKVSPESIPPSPGPRPTP